MNAAEVLFFILQPSNGLFALLALGLLIAAVRRPLGLSLAGAAACLIGASGLLPVGALLLAPLETRHPFEGITQAPAGIIVLGGAVDVKRSLDTHQIELNAWGERITAAAALARRYPDASVILTDGAPAGAQKSGAELMKVMLRDFGVAQSRIVREERARSTWDNARYTYDLVGPAPGERYVLVTSAFHMPRSLATFRAVGWDGLVAWPVDHQTDKPAWRAFPGSMARGLALTDLAAREYLALIAYRFAGRLGPPVSSGTAARRIGPRAASASTAAPRWVTARRPSATSRAAASRTEGISARQASPSPLAAPSSPASRRATSDGHTLFGARAAVSARIAAATAPSASAPVTALRPAPWRDRRNHRTTNMKRRGEGPRVA